MRSEEWGRGREERDDGVIDWKWVFPVQAFGGWGA